MKHSILKLRPTQFAIGHIEIRRKAHKLKAFSKAELHDYLHENSVPLVLGFKNTPFIIDHHHLVRACWEIGLEEVPSLIQADLNHLVAKEFWEVMHKSNWIHPFDQFGNGPHLPARLPEDIRCLADDPYRSLAWAVRRAGGYSKTQAPFAEFQWAELFRKHKIIEKKRGEHLEHDQNDWFEQALEAALSLCKTEACCHLPGYQRS